MSEDNNQEIFIVDADIQHVEKFFDHFKLDTPDYLMKAISDFKANKNKNTQNELRFCLAKALSTIKGKNELLDEVFDKVIECTTEVGYDLQFERDFEEIIGQNPDQKTPED